MIRQTVTKHKPNIEAKLGLWYGFIHDGQFSCAEDKQISSYGRKISFRFLRWIAKTSILFIEHLKCSKHQSDSYQENHLEYWKHLLKLAYVLSDINHDW